MAAGTYNFTIEQGTSFTKDIVWKDSNGTPIDVTGYTARMQVRASVAAPEVLLELTTEDDNIVMGTTDGKITLVLTDVETAALVWVSGVYDLEVESTTGVVTRLLKGTITVDPEVTR